MTPEEESLKMDGLDSKVAAQIATIMRHQVRQSISGDLQFTLDSVRFEAHEMTKETVDKFMQSNMETLVNYTVNSFLRDKLNLEKLVDDEVKRQISIIVSQKLKISISH